MLGLSLGFRGDAGSATCSGHRLLHARPPRVCALHRLCGSGEPEAAEGSQHSYKLQGVSDK